MVRAVLFDLDDTLFDHRRCARSALERLHRAHDCFRVGPFDEFERAHAAFLEELHGEVLAGRMRLEAARRERFRRLFHRAGMPFDEALVEEAASSYRSGYLEARQAVDGACALLPLVRQRAPVGIVSNNLLDEQQDKMRHCGFTPHVDVLVVSDEVGIAKPDPRIFEIALERLGAARHEAVMIGDSWTADVVGARAAGIRAIWFNPRGLPRPEGEDVEEIRSFVPPEAVLDVLFRGAAKDRAPAR